MEPYNRSRVLGAGGLIVLGGGVFTVLINSGLTPFLPVDAPFAELAASGVFAWRQSLAIVAALLLCLGSAALYLGHVERTGPASAVAFVAAFVGSAVLLAHEWNQLFFVRDLALLAPESLEALEDAPGMTLFDISALVAVSVFSLGWLAFAVSMLAHRLYSRTGPILLISGFILVPILGAALPGVWGQVVGNIVLSSGWIFLGLQLRRLARAEGQS
jgi:hypothetical protein